MARNTLEKIYLAMLNQAPRIEIPEELRLAAYKPIQRMLDMSASVPMSSGPTVEAPNAA
jgi:quinolinate synthase